MTNRLAIVQNQLVMVGSGGPLPLLQGQRVINTGSATGLVLVQAQDVIETLGTLQNPQQTDTSDININVFCSGLANNANAQQGNTASVGGTAGTVSNPIGMDASASRKIAVGWSYTPGGSVSWNAGTWVVKLEISTANGNCTWTDCFICRTNSSNVNQATIGSATGINQGLGSTGVKTSPSISGAAQTPNAGDKVWIILAFSNTQGTIQTFNYKSSQVISSPFTA